MSFHKKPLLILLFIALLGCKGLQYYQSGANPARISVVLKAPSLLYSNVTSTDSLQVFVVNNNSEPVQVRDITGKLKLIGQSRFYKKELMFSVNKQASSTVTLLAPGDTLQVVTLAMAEVLGNTPLWTYGNKPVYGPHLENAKKYYPYFFLSAQFETNVPNQEQVICIRSEQTRIQVQEFKNPGLTSKKTTLTLTSDTRSFKMEDPSGNLFCKITNLGNYPIPLFNDPGSVRFKIYAYNANRTSVMHTEYILNNGKLPVQPLNIGTGASQTITAPLPQLLFKEAVKDASYYWVWNKKNPPVSPLIYGKKEIAMEVEFWFGIVVDGKEYLSNTVTISIEHSVKRTQKKNR